MTQTTRILDLLRVSLHVLVATLLIVGLATTQLTILTAALAGLFAAVYLMGTIRRHRGSPTSTGGRIGWFVATIVIWLALLWRSSSFVWLEFPLVMLACYMFPGAAALLISLGLLGAAITASLPGSGWGGVIGPAIGTALGIFIVYAYRALRAEADHYQALEYAAGVAQERARLSREVHDTMAQGLSSIVLLGRALDRQLGDNAAAREILDTIRSTASDNLAAARQFVADNAPPSEPLPGRLQTLASATQDRQRALGRALAVRVDAVEVPEPAASIIERVAREGLSNIERHSQADQAVITVDMLGSVATVDVYDNGAGISGPEGFGLRGLRDRVEQAGGELTIDGNVLAASVPVQVGAQP